MPAGQIIAGVDTGETTKKWCPRCKTLKDRPAFCKNAATKDGFAGWCRACYAVSYRERKDYYQDYELRRRYGITTAEFDVLWAEQCGVCAICHELCIQHDHLSVDHDHKTGAVRGLLCGRCNQAIGLLREDISLFTNAIQYLTVNGA